ncbi:hypothetical protein D9M71_524420 [compost metagenome]
MDDTLACQQVGRDTGGVLSLEADMATADLRPVGLHQAGNSLECGALASTVGA